MQFPLWQYLNQRLFDADHPATLNPRRYWRAYQRWYLKRCFNHGFLEECWQLDYYSVVEHYSDFFERHYLEEHPSIFFKSCWMKPDRRRNHHPYR